MKILLIKRLFSTLLVIKICQSLTIYQSSEEPLDSRQTTASHITQFYAQQPAPLSSQSPNINFKMNEQPVKVDDFRRDQLQNSKSRKEPLFTNYHNKIPDLKNVKRTSPLAKNKQKFNAKKQINLRENHDNKLIERNIEEMENVNETSDRQSPKQPSTTTDRPTIETSHEIRYLHDIFLNYPKSHNVNFGHVELSPVLFEKRFESQKAGNRYKGEIMWLDSTGSFAQHYWDLAQGRL